MEYKIVYSKRKTIAITIEEGGVPVVKAPVRTKKKRIQEVVEKHSEWIEKHSEMQKKKESLFKDLSDDDIKKLKKDAKKYFTENTERFSKIMGINYGRITITSAQKRFGSCSSAGNISFSYRLMLYPEPAREYVIVHELAHRKQMNHSKAFYAIIAEILPDYKYRRLLLKKY